ncbi:Uncharacterised protein [Achromobacter xylosoxidans]|nr:Uncharacterised protein [Achromobacter xylosoxidans]
MENSISILDRHGKPLPAVRRLGTMLAPGGKPIRTSRHNQPQQRSDAVLIQVPQCCGSDLWQHVFLKNTLELGVVVRAPHAVGDPRVIEGFHSQVISLASIFFGKGRFNLTLCLDPNYPLLITWIHSDLDPFARLIAIPTDLIQRHAWPCAAVVALRLALPLIGIPPSDRDVCTVQSNLSLQAVTVGQRVTVPGRRDGFQFLDGPAEAFTSFRISVHQQRVASRFSWGNSWGNFSPAGSVQ